MVGGVALKFPSRHLGKSSERSAARTRSTETTAPGAARVTGRWTLIGESQHRQTHGAFAVAEARSMLLRAVWVFESGSVEVVMVLSSELRGVATGTSPSCPSGDADATTCTI